MDSLEHFDSPDLEVLAYLSDPTGEEISLEIGTDFYYETDDLTDDEIIEWAEGQGYFDDDEECDYLNDEGTPNVESLRIARRADEEENPTLESTPAGRAYGFFEDHCSNCPEDIKIDIIDSEYPGDNSYEVIANGISHLQRLQTFLLEKGLRVNFTLRKGY